MFAKNRVLEKLSRLDYNVRQEPGVGKGYVLAQDGSSEWTRITFSAAPVSGAVIWTNNRLRTQITNVLPGAGTITSTLLGSDSVTTINCCKCNSSPCWVS